jgi:2-oxo-3-hexenedioate decarboxylase
MTPELLLHHADTGEPWTAAPSDDPAFDAASAYRCALGMRALRLARGEVARGFKVGFTNRGIWARYGVSAPIWGTVYDSTVASCDGTGTLSLARLCQPRIEPEAVFGFATVPPRDADLDALFASLAWVAPGFEIVQSHLPGWKFRAPDTMADNGLHGRLLVGPRRPMGDVAESADALDRILAMCPVDLVKDGAVQESGCGANVLDSPLRALHHFVQELRQCPGAPDIAPGDIVTTGTWTDALPVAPGERWRAAFGAPLKGIAVTFTA